ncbi:unnamed protein product [Adineta ricciae]|uniref:Protein kinase domain-containing protein n=1 Tax=Adineta ricciae TaxID=249248 RepID=A0A814A243_ADIRI|nr:unnamed protein product [Adineta ricciae]
MPNKLTIQRVSPAYVARALAPQPRGTYLLRYQTTNDEIISSIQLKKSPTTALSQDSYVVLSVRVDEAKYQCSVMNYRLSYTEADDSKLRNKLLKQYKCQVNLREKVTKLTNELILPKENENWALDPKEFCGLDFTKGHFGGRHHAGASRGFWKKSRQEGVNIFVKRISVSFLLQHYNGNSLISLCPIIGSTVRSQMRRVVNIGFQIANAMMYLEKKRIVHRDLTASNVLIDSHGFVRITDFGHAIQKVDGRNYLISSCAKDGRWNFQPRFLAPECITRRRGSSSDQNYGCFSSKSDVWAFGLLMVQLMLDRPCVPYPNIINDEDVPRYVALERKFHIQPPNCNFDLYCVLQQCWIYEPIGRISFCDLREKMMKLAHIFN